MRTVSMAIVGLTLIACASGSLDSAEEKAVLEVVKAHYDATAIEEGGRCRQPVMDAVVDYEVLASGGDLLELRVRYTYSDPSVRFLRQCKQLAVRTFEVERGADGYEVVRMSGARGIGIRIDRMLTPRW